ncbi:MAG: hypothetical protein ACK559_10460 [bacterium]
MSALPQMVSQAKEDIGTVLRSLGLDFSFKISCNFFLLAKLLTFTKVVNVIKFAGIVGH